LVSSAVTLVVAAWEFFVRDSQCLVATSSLVAFGSFRGEAFLAGLAFSLVFLSLIPPLFVVAAP
jgi:hypothetical protein